MYSCEGSRRPEGRKDGHGLNFQPAHKCMVALAPEEFVEVLEKIIMTLSYRFAGVELPFINRSALVSGLSEVLYGFQLELLCKFWL